MTRNIDLANPPAEASPLHLDPAVIIQLTDALRHLASQPADNDLKCHTPAEAAELLGVSENWVNEAIRDGRIPCTYVGRFPRLTAAHIRQIQADGERKPNKYSRTTRAAA